MTTTVSRPAVAAAPLNEGLSHRRIVIIYFSLMLGMLLAALDQTIVSTALPTIVGDLGGLNHLSWVVTSYMITATCSTPLYGKMGDLFGRKIVFQAAIVIFLVGSALSGLSRSMIELILFRGVQGLGAGGLMVSAFAIIGDILSPRERGKYQGYMTTMFTFSSVAGPAIGGLLTQDLSWRWCFYVNVPVGAVALVVIGSVLDIPFPRTKHRIDFGGAGLLVAAVGTVLLVTVWGGVTYPWASGQVLGLIAAALVLIGLFVWRERRAEEPVLPMYLFRNGVFNATNVAGFLAGMAMFGGTVYIPLFLQLVSGVAPAMSGILIFPMMLGVTISSITTGRLITKTGRYKLWPIIGGVLMPIGMFLLSFMTAGTPAWLSGIFMLPLGLGMGMIMPVLVVAVQNAVPQRDLGTATSSSTFFRSMGMSFGVAIFGTIMNARLKYWFPRLVPNLGNHLNLSSTSVAFSPSAVHKLPPAIREGIIQSFAHSLHTVFLWATPIALLVIPAILFMKELPLRTGAYIKSADPSGEHGPTGLGAAELGATAAENSAQVAAEA